jgi:hypothetical protein
MDGNISSTRRVANDLGQRGSLSRFAGHRRDPDKLALRLSEKVGKRDGIIDIIAYVRIEEHLHRPLD